MGDEHFEEMIADLEDDADALDDDGHAMLIANLEDLINEAREGKYHDFHRNGDAAPKIALASKFEELRANVMKGLYDN